MEQKASSSVPSGDAAMVPVTHLLAQWIAAAEGMALTPRAIEWARHVMLDWLAVTLAGASEPLVRILVEEYAGTDAGLPCVLLAGGGRARPHEAALINGAAGHALDYDDVLSLMHGHPAVAVVPAALAQAQAIGAHGPDLLRAVIVGYEVAARIGEMIGPGHYQQGFHATGTVGTLAAAAACASLRRLDSGRTAHALGLAATQAAGLKCMFGTMAKPLHAGKAAMNGLMAVQLAARGFTANPQGIECTQGFARTLAPSRHPFAVPIDTSAGFAIERALFKYHASCFLTHSSIEAIGQLRRLHGLTLEALESMTLTVGGNHRGVCDIVAPQSGLQLKFSIQQLAALALDGANTADLGLYTDGSARSARHVRAAERIELIVDPTGDRDAAVVALRTRDGRVFTQTANAAIPAADLSVQWDGLLAKAQAIARPVLGDTRFHGLIHAVRTLDQAPSLHSFLESIQ